MTVPTPTEDRLRAAIYAELEQSIAIIDPSDPEALARSLARRAASVATKFFLSESPRLLGLTIYEWSASRVNLHVQVRGDVPLLGDKMFWRETRNVGNDRRGYWLRTGTEYGEVEQCDRPLSIALSNLVLATPELAAFGPIYLITKDQP